MLRILPVIDGKILSTIENQGTPLKDLVGILVKEKISGVPVVSLQGKVVGVATERDLLKKEELQRDLPVVGEHEKLLGVTGPRDLLQVFLRKDDEIRSEIVSQVLEGEFATYPALVHIKVTEGVVRMTGELELKSMLPLVLRLVRAIDGVIDAEGEFTYAIDDTRLPHVPDMTEY